MDANALPRPNNQALSWFYGEHQKQSLLLRPHYQRNPIWSIGQKCFLIDSLISGFPLPQVYINIISQIDGSVRKTLYEVVDGQQRLTSILEFIGNKWSLSASAAHAYPVSDIYSANIGKTFSELPEDLQERIWNYPLVVQELRGWDEKRIRELFRRLNYVVEKLNPQELRHSQYFGQFLKVVERFAELEIWDQLGIFTRRDSARMKDVEFISELFVLTISGVQDQQKSLDQFYAKYDVDFPGNLNYRRRFRRVVDSIESISELVAETRLSKKADFYALFGAVLVLTKEAGAAVDLTDYEDNLRRLDNRLSGDPTRLTGIYARYYSTVIEGPNKLAKRKERIEILLELMRDE